MKSIICEEPNVFKEENIAIPVRNGGEAIIRIKRIGICGTDLHAYKGNQPYFTYPRILGHELSGTIEEIDNNTGNLQVGDQVTIIPFLHCGICIACRRGKTNCCEKMEVIGVHRDGGMCEMISIPTNNMIKTEGLTLDESAMVEPLAIGAHAVRRTNITSGETVLVIGAGPIGLGVMQMAKKQGARVIAMDVNEERLTFCRAWASVGEVVNALEEPVQALKELTNGGLPTIVFDATGNVHSMSGAIQYVAHGGELVYVGLVNDNINFFNPDFHKKEITLLGSRNATREDFEDVLEVLQEGGINIEDYITHRCKFEDMIHRFDRWLLPESKVIKAIVEL
jgi:2-desacetyl-2-hydroxyethyl bacteriochlorophyllide A dehydrogenase